MVRATIRRVIDDSPDHSWRYETALVAVVLAVLIWSGIKPFDRATWAMEVFPVVIGVPLLILTRRRLRFTRLVYTCIAIHCCILMVGGRYTYAEVPIGNWIRDTFHLSRNHYDRLGHFAQGFEPALIARELLLRTSPLQRGKWLFTIVVSVCLAISALYELLEWSASVLTGSAADKFLGTQGDPFDTQKDMAMAGTGALVAIVCFASWQDRQMLTQGRQKAER